MTMTETAFIGLGSNIGDREAYLLRAVRQLHQVEGVQVTGVSAIYETDPVGPVPQQPFLNMVAKVRTTRAPLELLDALLHIEHTLGRVRLQKWGPRTIDLDLLLYGTCHLEHEQLIVPHPRMWERAFVLVPLSDIMAPGEDPRLDAALRSEDIQQEADGVRRWKMISWPEEFALSAN